MKSASNSNCHSLTFLNSQDTLHICLINNPVEKALFFWDSHWFCSKTFKFSSPSRNKVGFHLPAPLKVCLDNMTN